MDADPRIPPIREGGPAAGGEDASAGREGRRGAEEPPRLPAVFDGADAAVHVFDDDGVIRQANPAFDRMFGSARGEYLGRHLAALTAGSVEADLALLGEIRAVTATGVIWRGRFQNQRRDGSRFGTRAQVYPMWLGDRRYLVCLQETEPPVLRTGGAGPVRGPRLAGGA